MKKIKFTYTLVLVLVVLVSNYSSSFSQCREKKAIAKAAKPLMKPFHYDGMAYSDIVFDGNEKIVNVEFTAYAGEKYKLLFCKSNFKENVVIKVYDKHKKNKTRKIIYNSSTTETTILGFEPPRSGNYFIEYEVPISPTGVRKDECMVLLIGYK